MRGSAKAAIGLAAVALFAAACSSSSSGSSAGGSPSASAGGSKFLACMVTDTGGIDDKSFNQTSWQGMQEAAAANPNVTVKYLPSTAQSDYAKNISQFESQKCGIIVTVGYSMGDATKAAAAASPTQKFAIVDYSYTPVISNVDGLVFNTVQDAYQGGYLAAGMSKTGKVATYGGMQFGTVTIYMDGFADGVAAYNTKHHTNVQVLGWDSKTQKGTFAGNFTSLADGQTIAQTFINEGADVIFPVAGGVGLGTAKAVQTADQAGKSIMMEWVDTDGCVSAAAYCQYFITSVQKGIASAVKTAVLSAASGKFTGGDYIGTLANGGAALAPYHDWSSKIPAKLRAEITQIGKDIRSGTINPATKSPVG